jgi:uncharacterized protein
MLSRFSVENFLSFKNRITLDFQAGTIKEMPEHVYAPVYQSDVRFLKCLGLYGRNSSGKSNIIKAFAFMRNLVLNSSKESQANEAIPVSPFRLATDTEKKPSVFEIIFHFQEARYRYGFSVTQTMIEEEWLFQTSVQKRKEELVFIRARKDFNIDKKFKQENKGKVEVLIEMTRYNTLFLSILSQFNVELGKQITTWFDHSIVALDTDHMALVDFSAKLLTEELYKKSLNDIIKFSDLGIESVEERVKELAHRSKLSHAFLSYLLQDDQRNYEVRTRHIKYSDNNEQVGNVYFDLLISESLGTQKYFGLLGPILMALREKRILWIDEVDARLHPVLLENIIKLFNSLKYNAQGAQLIFTSHNTYLLEKKLRRDQMIFVEKDKYGVSNLESLYKKDPTIRKDASFDKIYLSGDFITTPPKIESSQLNLFE